MTDEQKISALQKILQGANVAQVNLGNGYQTFNMGKDGNWQQVPDADGETAEAEVVGEDQAPKADKSRGPRKKVLFPLDGSDTKLNVAVLNREKQRLCDYLGRHCLKSRRLVCVKEDTLNRTVVCFLLRWMDMSLTSEEPSGAAIFRFLTEDCGIVSEVQEKAYANRVKEWISTSDDYDTEVMMTVREAFSSKEQLFTSKK